MAEQDRPPQGTESEPNADILPEDAPRGGTTVPQPNDTGMTTPPISGWGETPVRDDDTAVPDDSPDGNET